jgi:hypothetical protein
VDGPPGVGWIASAPFEPEGERMSDQHPIDPRPVAPSGPFKPRKSPTGVAVGSPEKSTFKMKLSQGGNPIGYCGVDSSGYAVLADGAANAVKFEPYPFGTDMYYRNHANGMWLSISLSLSSYAGFYNNWFSAEPCVYNKDTRTFVCSDGGQALSLYSRADGYLYFRDDYSVLQVDVEHEH